MSDPTNTDAQTSDMDAQTTPDAGGAPATPDPGEVSAEGGAPASPDTPAQVEYEDGSEPPVGDDGIPIVHARTRRLGPGSGLSAPYGLMAKRAAKRAARDAASTAEEPPAAADEGFDPSAHTVAEVTAYLDSHNDQAEYVLDRERAGKARVTLIGA